MKYVLAWTGEQALLFNSIQMERYKFHPYILGNKLKDAFIWAKEGYVESYFAEQGIDEELLEDAKKLLDESIQKDMVEKTHKTAQNYWIAAKKVRETVSEEITDKELLEKFEIIADNIRLIMAYFIYSREELTISVEKELTKNVKEQFTKDFQDILLLITTPTEPDILHEEKIAFLDLMKKPSKEKMRLHALKFPFIFYNITSMKDAISILEERIADKSEGTIAKEIKDANIERESVKKRQNKVFKEMDKQTVRLDATHGVAERIE